MKLHSQGCLSEKQARIDRVSTRLLSDYGVPLAGAIGTETRQSIRKRLMSKLWRMGKMLSEVGGPKRNKIISEWKKTEWLLMIDSPEAEPWQRENNEVLKRENAALHDVFKEMEPQVRDTEREVAKLQAEVRVLKLLNENAMQSSPAGKSGSYKKVARL